MLCCFCTVGLLKNTHRQGKKVPPKSAKYHQTVTDPGKYEFSPTLQVLGGGTLPYLAGHYKMPTAGHRMFSSLDIDFLVCTDITNSGQKKKISVFCAKRKEKCKFSYQTHWTQIVRSPNTATREILPSPDIVGHKHFPPDIAGHIRQCPAT